MPTPITTTIARLASGSIHDGAGPQDQRAGDHHAEADQRVGRHVQERAAHVDVALAPAGEQQRGGAVDDDADPGDDDHDQPGTGCGIEQPVDRLDQDRARGDQQQPGVGQRGEHRAGLVAVGEARVGRPRGHHRGAPGDQQAEHVRQVVPGVGEQRHRARQQAERRLDQHEGRIEHDADGERVAEIGRSRGRVRGCGGAPSRVNR